jgi:hypothetical protein
MDTKATSPAAPLLPANWQVPQPFRDRLGQGPGRQRTMEASGHMLVVLHEPPDADDEARVGRVFWRDPAGNWMPKALRHGDHSLGELIAEYDQVIDRLDEREERADSPEEYFAILKDLSPLVRAANNLHNTLQKAREAAPDDKTLIVLRDAAYAMARRVELLAADTRHALDYRIAMRAEEQAENSEKMAAASHRLNLLVAFFFPIATIAGIFGMNLHNPLEGMSEATDGLVTMGILVIGLVLGVILTAFVTLPVPKRKRRKER